VRSRDGVWTLARGRREPQLLSGIEGNQARARHVLAEGEELFCALSWDNTTPIPSDCEEANRRLDATSKFWRHWLARARIPDHGLRRLIQRSALAIKGLTYMPTGSI
jgi:GH15 family glucan-1,4-alpha-glucosidase